MCRTCFFDTPLYMELNPDVEIPPYVDCPCCVLAVYKKIFAANEDGARCEATNQSGWDSIRMFSFVHTSTVVPWLSTHRVVQRNVRSIIGGSFLHRNVCHYGCFFNNRPWGT